MTRRVALNRGVRKSIADRFAVYHLGRVVFDCFCVFLATAGRAEPRPPQRTSSSGARSSSAWSARFYRSDSGAASWGSYFSRRRAVARLQICRGLFDVPYTIAYRTDSASIHLAKSWQQSRWLSHLALTLENRSLKGNPGERPRPPCGDRGLSLGRTVPSLTHTTRTPNDSE